MDQRAAEDVLRDAKVDVAKLVVAFVGQDCVVGELDALHPSGDPRTSPTLPRGYEIVDRVITLRSPKRLLTVRMQCAEGIAIRSFIGPLEVMDGGSISLKPTMAFTLREASESTRQSVFGLYANHLGEMKTQECFPVVARSGRRTRTAGRSRR